MAHIYIYESITGPTNHISNLGQVCEVRDLRHAQNSQQEVNPKSINSNIKTRGPSDQKILQQYISILRDSLNHLHVLHVLTWHTCNIQAIYQVRPDLQSLA